MASLSVNKIEPGMKLASPVVTAGGQTILTSGIILEETHIDFLKRRGVRTVKVVSSEYSPVDKTAFEKADAKITGKTAEEEPRDEANVESIDPGGPIVVLDKMPVEHPPADAPTARQVERKEIEKSAGEWKTRRETRRKKMEEQHGEKYAKVTKALGDPKSLAPEPAAFQPAKLFSDSVKDLTEHIYLEKKINEDTIDMLTGNITMEIVSRQGMASLLGRAQAAGQYLLAHMVNVGVYAMYLSIQMELSSEEIRNTSIGGLLSDIGMLAMPEQFWVQDRELWKKEVDQLKRHPKESEKLILETAGSQPEWAKIALEHHERLDGGGYPRGLKAKDISIYSRIVQICDVYSAATADRAYRDANLPDDAMRQIMGRPGQFDRSIVEIFCQLVGFYPEGYIVLLSSGEHGVVINVNPKNVFRPTIRLRKDRNGRPLMPNEQHIIDLSTRPDLRIIKILEDDTIRWV